MDIPWVRKGDRIGVGFNKSGFTWCMVKEITHNCDDLTMHLVVRKLKKLKNASGKGTEHWSALLRHYEKAVREPASRIYRNA